MPRHEPDATTITAAWELLTDHGIDPAVAFVQARVEQHPDDLAHWWSRRRPLERLKSVTASER